MSLTEETEYAKVAVDVPVQFNLEGSFLYSIPQEIKNQIKPGSIVHVPFGKQELNGYVVEILSSITDNLFEKDKKIQIRPIYDVIYKNPIWDEKYLQLAEWVSNYYFTNIGTVLSLSVNSEILTKYSHELKLIKHDLSIDSLTNEQQFIINKFLKSKKSSLSYKFLQQKSKFNKTRFYQLINQLKNKGIVTSRIIFKNKEKIHKNPAIQKNNLEEMIIPRKKLVLNNEQEIAYKTILKSIHKVEFNKFLLHGITGSGKTEVYLNLIEEVLTSGKNAIYLVPEIYLIPQVYERLKARFKKSEIIIWHSSLTKKESLYNWKRLQENLLKKEDTNTEKVRIILGARSAILSPIKNLGIIIIDEAHESSYKQFSPPPRYNTIKVAYKRGELENCPVVLGTATPNISDYYECLKNNSILTLSKRIKDFPMPQVNIIDLKSEYPKSDKNIVSNYLKSSINDALLKNEQIILLLNRRGYSSQILCRSCGFIQYCKNCSVPMVFHKNYNLMICHHCGYRISTDMNSPDKNICPNCRSPHFQFVGIGTQQLEEEVKNTFKTAKTLRVDSDQLKRKDEYLKLWSEFSSGRADILIGTQLVAKGLDLPNVTVVGVILADTMLNFPDYISYEKAFQLLTQVTGRAGRGNKPGKVFIQTYQNENPIFEHIKCHDYYNFYKNELLQRKQFLYPPFTILSRIIFQSYDENDCINYANQTHEALSEIINKTSAAILLGPAPCFFTKLHNKYRYHILCKSKNEETKNQIFNKYFQTIAKSAKVEVIVDVDSTNLL